MWLSLLAALWAETIPDTRPSELRSRIGLGPSTFRVAKGRSGWTSKTDPFDVEGETFWHATTELDAVVKEGRLLSRNELLQKGFLVKGLGGGWRNEAANQVSLATTRDAAERVADGLLLMALAIRGHLSGAQVLSALRDLDSALLWEIDSGMSALHDEEDDESVQLAAAIETDFDATERRLRDLPRGDTVARSQALYEAILAVESTWVDARESLAKLHLADEDAQTSGIGFTLPYARYLRLDPDQIGVVEVAVRMGAPLDIVPAESEVRVNPADAFVLRAVRTPPALRARSLR